MAAFEIYELPVGYGTAAISPLPGIAGNYAADFSKLVKWSPEVVLSMTESHEMARVDADNLGSELAIAGIKWLHLPIGDFGTPDIETSRKWQLAETTCLEVLNGGGKVLAHCRGGCGRSGMAILRLMVASGEDSGVALERLRIVRACAVETDAQFEWVTQFIPKGSP